jgi:hypothetical protein
VSPIYDAGLQETRRILGHDDPGPTVFMLEESVDDDPADDDPTETGGSEPGDPTETGGSDAEAQGSEEVPGGTGPEKPAPRPTPPSRGKTPAI